MRGKFYELILNVNLFRVWFEVDGRPGAAKVPGLEEMKFETTIDDDLMIELTPSADRWPLSVIFPFSGCFLSFFKRETQQEPIKFGEQTTNTP